MTFATSNMFAQNDLAVSYKKYPNGFITNADTLFTDFYIKNKGSDTLFTNDTIYISTRINSVYFDLLLIGSSTPYILADNLNPGDSVLINSGYLLSQASLLFFPGATTLEVCIVVWGKGLATVNTATGTIINDVNTGNNITCLMYDPAFVPADSFDIAVRYDNYASVSQTNADTLFLNFTLFNNGSNNFHTGDTLYLSSRLNGMYMGLDLLGTETPYVLTADLNAGDSLKINPGFLVAQETLLFFPGFTTLETCVVVWGKGKSSVDIVNGTFSLDTHPADNIACVTYDNTITAVKNQKLSNINIHVFPNPAEDKFTLNFSQQGEYTITLTGITGSILKSIETGMLSQVQMDVNQLEKDIYFCNVYDVNNNLIYSSKILKK